MHRPTRMIVDLDAIARNIRAIKAHVGPKVRIMPAVKADGYGHGSVRISRAALSAGADMLGVASVDEAVELRDNGIRAPVLVFGCASSSSADDIISSDISATVCELSAASDLSVAASKLQKPVRVHIKVDTGMGRVGVPAEEAVELVAAVSELPFVVVEGIFTHFASSDEPDRSFTKSQMTIFSEVLSQLRERRILPPIAHTANSGAIMDYPLSHYDMVRPGIAAYGWYPSPDVNRTVNLTPALTLVTNIAYVKELPPGKTISYGRTFTTTRRTKVATLPIGYADGYSRKLSNCGDVAVKGYRAPVVGRVCMDQILVDVTEVPEVAVGDEVVLLGGGYDYLSVEGAARTLETVPHDVLTSIGKRVPRVYIKLHSDVLE